MKTSQERLREYYSDSEILTCFKTPVPMWLVPRFLPIQEYIDHLSGHSQIGRTVLPVLKTIFLCSRDDPQPIAFG